MTWILSFLLGNPIGRALGIGLIGLLMLSTVVTIIYRKGAASERAKQRLQQMDRVRKRIAVDKEVRSMSPVERRRELRRWVSD